MKKLALYALLVGGVALSSVAVAGADPTPAPSSSTAETAPTVPDLPDGDKADPTEGHKEVAGTSAPPSAEELAKENAEVERQNTELKESLAKLKTAWDDLRNGAGAGKLLLWMLLVAAACNVLLNLLKVLSPYIGKRASIVKWIALGLGVVTGAVAAYAGGASLLVALVVFGLGPVLAIAVHELGSPILDRLLKAIRPA